MKFFLYVNSKKDKDYLVAENIATYLCDNDADFCVDAAIYDVVCDKKHLSRADFLAVDECASVADVAIVVGGDGTILKAAKLLYGKDIPIIGVNMGTVGYMSELEKTELGYLSALFSSSKDKVYTTDERMMLSCKVIRDGIEVYKNFCLNEVVVAKGDIARMIDIELKLDGTVIAEYQCDGIITATPTGSTAYSMSAGGAIIDPRIQCISVVPLCPYLCINSSPIIFSEGSVIEIIYKPGRENSAYISTDGEESFKLMAEDRIIISKADSTTKLLRFKKVDFYKLLNMKLTNRISELADKT